MRIVKIEDLHCNAGWRDFSFLKITTDTGIGWGAEVNKDVIRAHPPLRPVKWKG